MYVIFSLTVNRCLTQILGRFDWNWPGQWLTSDVWPSKSDDPIRWHDGGALSWSTYSIGLLYNQRTWRYCHLNYYLMSHTATMTQSLGEIIAIDILYDRVSHVLTPECGNLFWLSRNKYVKTLPPSAMHLTVTAYARYAYGASCVITDWILWWHGTVSYKSVSVSHTTIRYDACNVQINLIATKYHSDLLWVTHWVTATLYQLSTWSHWLQPDDDSQLDSRSALSSGDKLVQIAMAKRNDDV